MTQEQLRIECLHLMELKTLEDNLTLIQIFAEYFFLVIEKHHDDPVYSYADADAKMLHQMIFSKVIHLKKIIEGIPFHSVRGLNLNPIIDPTIVASLVRNIYETVGLFNLIYINPRYQESSAGRLLILNEN